jgi:hypothetical protein
MTIDPLSENYSFQSPYAYAVNNPIKFQDVNRMGPGIWDMIKGLFDFFGVHFSIGNGIRTYRGGASSGRWGICLDGSISFEQNMASKGFVYVKNEYGIGSWCQISESWQTISLGPGKPDIVIRQRLGEDQRHQSLNRYQIEILVKGNMFSDYNFVQTKKYGNEAWELDKGWKHNNGFFYTDDEKSDYKFFTKDYYSTGADGYFEDSPNAYNFKAELTILGKRGNNWEIIQTISWGYSINKTGNLIDKYFSPSKNQNDMHQENIQRTLNFWNKENIH